MKIQITILVLLGGLLLGCAASSGDQVKDAPPEGVEESVLENQGQMLPISAQTTLGGEKFELEVTQTPEQQALGLMFRESLPDNRGMLFEFTPPRITQFWMKNVPISLDMIFLKDGVIKAIAKEVPPCPQEPCATYGPNVLIDQVIELRGGRAAELGLKRGDVVTIQRI